MIPSRIYILVLGWIRGQKRNSFVFPMKPTLTLLDRSTIRVAFHQNIEFPEFRRSNQFVPIRAVLLLDRVYFDQPFPRTIGRCSLVTEDFIILLFTR